MYGKIFDSMYEGTLYGHWEAIVTLQQMLVLCNKDGLLDMTPQAIAARTSIPLDIIVKGIGILSEPDPYTRTPGEDGKRIVLMDAHRPWGWVIVNYTKYRDIQSRAQKNEADRIRIADQRKAKKDSDVAERSNVSPPVADVAHVPVAVPASVTAKERVRAKARRAPQTPLPDEFKISERVRQWAEGKGFGDLEKHLEFFIGKAKAKAYVYADWDEALMNAIRDDWAKVKTAKPGEAPVVMCGRCGGSLFAGHIFTQEFGPTCNGCYHERAA